MIKLKGKITISSPQYGDGRELVSIDVEDVNSHCQAINIEMSYENFTKAIIGRGHIDCDIEFNDTGIIGKTKEHQTVMIPEMEGYGSHTDSEIAAHMLKDDAVNELFLAGWKPRYNDFRNHYNRNDSGMCHVTFERWV